MQPNNNLQNPFILWDMTCNPVPTPCGGVATQDQTCAATQTWFWLILAGIAVMGLMGGTR